MQDFAAQLKGRESVFGRHLFFLRDAWLQSCFDFLSSHFIYHCVCYLFGWENQMFYCEGQGRFMMSGEVSTDTEEGRNNFIILMITGLVYFTNKAVGKFEKWPTLLGKSSPFGHFLIACPTAILHHWQMPACVKRGRGPALKNDTQTVYASYSTFTNTFVHFFVPFLKLEKAMWCSFGQAGKRRPLGGTWNRT